MASKSKTHAMLESAGFKVSKVYPGAKWFEVVSPDGDVGFVLCQSFAAWHFFYSGFVGTASDSSPARCHLGGLGDAIGTDSQMRTYRRLLDPANVPAAIRECDSVWEAIRQAAY